MVWSGEIITHNFRSVRSKKYRARMTNLRRYRFVVASHNFQMLWGQLIDNLASFAEVVDH